MIFGIGLLSFWRECNLVWMLERFDSVTNTCFHVSLEIGRRLRRLQSLCKGRHGRGGSSKKLDQPSPNFGKSYKAAASPN